MEERETGLILRTRPLTETSLIVNWLTSNSGRVSTVAKGARRPKSSFRGKLDLFHLAEFTFTRSRRSELHNLREVNLLYSFEGLRRDLDRLQQVAYAAAFIEQVTERETPLEDIYELMLTFVRHVDASEWGSQSVLWFELKLLSILGNQPSETQAAISPRTKRLVADLFESETLAPDQFLPDVGEVKELIRFLNGFIIYHFDRIPKGRASALRHEE